MSRVPDASRPILLAVPTKPPTTTALRLSTPSTTRRHKSMQIAVRPFHNAASRNPVGTGIT